jgi:hypothetical protein
MTTPQHPESEPHDFPTTPDELSFDEADALGLDATGRDGDPRFPWTLADLTDVQRQRLAELRATPAGPTAAPAPADDNEPGLRVLSMRDVATLAAGLVEYAASDRELDAPELQVLSRYAPVNGPASFDLNLIHESVWRGWPGAGALPEQVDTHAFLGLLANLPDTTPWAQPEPHFTVVGLSLRYDAPPEPGPAPSRDYAMRNEPARVLVAVDADHRFYHHVRQTGAAAGQVAVWWPTTIGPLDTPNRVTHGDRSALNQLSRLMDRLRTPTDPPADTTAPDEDLDPLVAGELVTVTGERFDDDERAQLWVVIDHFFDYAIAVLGGNGYEWRKIPRGDLVRATPQWIQRTIRHDGTFAYVGADTTAPVLVEETFHRHVPGSYELTRVYRLAGQVLRIRVRRDVHPDTSLAQAQVLNPPGGYTAVAETPVQHWYPATAADARDGAPLEPVAEDLLQRAARILTPPEPTGT